MIYDLCMTKYIQPPIVSQCNLELLALGVADFFGQLDVVFLVHAALTLLADHVRQLLELLHLHAVQFGVSIVRPLQNESAVSREWTTQRFCCCHAR